MFEELIIKVGYESFKTQFDSFKLQAGKKYSIFVELADRDIRNPETLIIQNKLNNAIDESEADLITLFDFIKYYNIKLLKFNDITLTSHIWVLLGKLIELSNLEYFVFIKCFCQNDNFAFTPFIMRSKLKSMTWIDCRINKDDIRFENKMIKNNYYLQEIKYINSGLIQHISEYVDYKNNKLFYNRNIQLAKERFRITIFILLINRFSYKKYNNKNLLSDIPVDVFRIISKLFYHNFLEK